MEALGLVETNALEGAIEAAASRLGELPSVRVNPRRTERSNSSCLQFDEAATDA